MSILYQIKASAGSGKTHSLTRLYLDYLVGCRSRDRRKHACGIELEQRREVDWSKMPMAIGDILAVTFTNAAVAEMRSRVLKDLKKAALRKTVIENIDDKHAMATLERLLPDMGDMNIRTIDSLLHQIVRSSALALGLSPDFTPTFSTLDALQPYLDKFARSAESGDAHTEKLMEEVIEQAIKYEDARGNPAGPKMLLPTRNFSGLLKPFLEEALLRQANTLAPMEDIQKILEGRIADAVSAAQDFMRKSDEAGKLAKKPTLAIMEAKRKLLEAFCNRDFHKKNLSFPQTVEEIFKKPGREKNPELLSKLENSYARLRDALEGLDEVWDPFTVYLKNAPLIEVSKRLANEFDENRENETLLPSFLIAAYARDALGSQYGICDALCRMGNRLSHFLLDEFQDTSTEQWEALKPFVADALSRNGSLIYVGDVKQSVYAWRKAAPELFDEVLMDGELSDMVEEPKSETLEFNYRSHKKITEFNNRLFSPLGDEQCARQAIKHMFPSSWRKDGEKLEAILQKSAPKIVKAYAESGQESPPATDAGGYVNIECLGDEGGFDEHFLSRLVDDLNCRIHPGRQWADIMILVRKNEEAKNIAAHLVANEIPVVTENSLSLAGHPLIEQFMAFLAFLDNPRNEPALLSLLTGSIVREHPRFKSLPGAADLAMLKNGGSLLKYFAGNYPELWQNYLQPFYGKSTLLTAYDAICEWSEGMAVEERFGEDSLFLRSFLEVLQIAETKGTSSISGFLEFWAEKGGDAKAHTPDNIDALRIMTIHKAKGLQEKVVIVPLPDRNMKIKANNSDANIIREVAGQKVEVSLLNTYEPEYSDKVAKDTLEAVNILYVAFTRPKEELYIYTDKRDGTFLSALAEGAGMRIPCQFGEKAILAGGEEEAQNSGESAGEKCCGAMEERIDPMEWLQRLKIAHNYLSEKAFAPADRGTFLHFCLENMQITADPAADAQRALQFGLSHSGIDVPEVESIREEMLQSLCWYASKTPAKQWMGQGLPEQSVMNAAGEELRVDLLVPCEDGCLVVDYKTGSQKPEHVKQVQSYLSCLRQSGMYKGKLEGILVYLDERKFRLVTERDAREASADYPQNLEGGK